MTRTGFPHSDIPGSTLVCSSPRLIAAYHVLHRLLTPRHPPCALSSLIHTESNPSVCEVAYLDYQSLFGFQRSDGNDPRDSRGVVSVKLYTASDRPSGHPAGGDNRDRTGNLRLAKPALSQLSYIPVRTYRHSVVGLGRFELPTSRLSGVRSNQLSYRP